MDRSPIGLRKDRPNVSAPGKSGYSGSRVVLPGAELGHYELARWVIMANHVHVLLLPRAAPSRLLKSLEGSTAREANRLLARTGEPFCSGNPMIIGFAMKGNGAGSRCT